MTALVDEEMAAHFSGDVILTVRDTPTVLSPDQVRALRYSHVPSSCTLGIEEGKEEPPLVSSGGEGHLVHP